MCRRRGGKYTQIKKNGYQFKPDGEISEWRFRRQRKFVSSKFCRLMDDIKREEDTKAAKQK